MKVKIHNGYRDMIAICDSELIGKKFEQGKMQIDIKASFFDGDEKNESEVLKIIHEGATEDVTFNIVGGKSIAIAIKSGIIIKESVMTIQNIPVALVLL